MIADPGGARRDDLARKRKDRWTYGWSYLASFHMIRKHAERVSSFRAHVPKQLYGASVGSAGSVGGSEQRPYVGMRGLASKQIGWRSLAGFV